MFLAVVGRETIASVATFVERIDIVNIRASKQILMYLLVFRS